MTSQEINTTIAAHDGYVKQRVVTNSPLYATKVTYYMVPDDPDYFKDANIDGHLIAVKRDWGTDIKHTKTKVHGGCPLETNQETTMKEYTENQMTLTGQKAWQFIRSCVENKNTKRLQDFTYSFGKNSYLREADHLSWAIERDYTQKGGKRIKPGEKKPIEVCLSMKPRPGDSGYMDPIFLWEDYPFPFDLTMEPVLHFEI